MSVIRLLRPFHMKKMKICTKASKIRQELQITVAHLINLLSNAEQFATINTNIAANV